MQYLAEKLFDGSHMKYQQVIDLENGKIIGMRDAVDGDSGCKLSGLLTPAFIDVQVNGGGGSLFNNDPSLACIKTMIAAHRQFGTGSMLPTLITDDLAVMSHAADAIAQAIALNVRGVLGVHFEGPHLCEGRKGIHPSKHIRQISDEEMRIFTRKDIGQVCVTVAPDNVSSDIIEALVRENVIVSLGHSNATDTQTFDALSAGATGFTHLYNAMSPLQGRASGMVGAALLDDSSYCGLIADNEHVSINSGKLAIKCKTPEKLMLVTDAMAHVGCNEAVLPFAGMDITRVGNKLTINNGTLAGSALDMLSAVKNAVNLLDCSLAQALKMASTTPANFLKLAHQKGRIEIGHDADWLLLDKELNISSMILNGEVVK